MDWEARWFPTGDQIVFRSDRDGNNEIYVMAANGADPRNLTNDSGSDSGPTWSPDGSRIAFTAMRNGNSDIYVMNADGSEEVRLTDAPWMTLAWRGRPMAAL